MRLGGDEFAVYAVGIVKHEMVEAIVRRLFDRLDSIVIPELHGEKVSISVGATLYKGNKPTSFDELYLHADNAMYSSKKESGNKLTFRETEETGDSS